MLRIKNNCTAGQLKLQKLPPPPNLSQKGLFLLNFENLPPLFKQNCKMESKYALPKVSGNL